MEFLDELKQKSKVHWSEQFWAVPRGSLFLRDGHLLQHGGGLPNGGGLPSGGGLYGQQSLGRGLPGVFRKDFDFKHLNDVAAADHKGNEDKVETQGQAAADALNLPPQAINPGLSLTPGPQGVLPDNERTDYFGEKTRARTRADSDDTPILGRTRTQLDFDSWGDTQPLFAHETKRNTDKKDAVPPATPQTPVPEAKAVVPEAVLAASPAAVPAMPEVPQHRTPAPVEAPAASQAIPGLGQPTPAAAEPIPEAKYDSGWKNAESAITKSGVKGKLFTRGQAKVFIVNKGGKSTLYMTQDAFFKEYPAAKKQPFERVGDTRKLDDAQILVMTRAQVGI